MRIKDDGSGGQSVVYGFGLQSMEEKVEAVGGQLSIQSEPNNGFELYIRMPVAKVEG